MAGYCGASICTNGHVISIYNANEQNRCSKCGSKVHSRCGNCLKPIHGTINDIMYIDPPYDRPNYCHDCGEPYPWTLQVIDNAVELLSLDTGLDEETKEVIKAAIPNLLIDSPTTPVAVAKYKIGMGKASKIVKDAAYNLLIDVISETAKKTFFD